MRNKHIVIMTGNIGSGKSTLVNFYIEDNYSCVCRDGLRYMLGNGQYKFERIKEPVIWKTEKFMIEEFMKAEMNVVVDEVGVSKQLRKPYVELAKKYGYTITAIVMPKLTKKESVDRRMKNPHGQPNRKLWEEVWTKFNRIYTEPSKKEGFNEIIHIRRHL
jgi:predicted kinase